MSSRTARRVAALSDADVLEILARRTAALAAQRAALAAEGAALMRGLLQPLDTHAFAAYKEEVSRGGAGQGSKLPD